MAEEGFLPPIVAVLKGNIKDFSAKMDEAMVKSKETEGSLGSSAKNVAKSAGMGLLAVGGLAIAVGTEAVKMADSYEAAHVRLQVVTHNTGENLNKFNKLLKEQENHFADLGYNSTEYEQNLALLVPAAGSVEKATRLMGVAANLAAARNMDMNKAVLLVSKVSQGNTTILKRMGIDLGIAAGGATKVAKANQQLQKAAAAVALVEQKIHDGRLKGVAATDAARAAYGKLTTAQQNLTDATDAGRLGVAALEKKFGGSAAAQADTFGGKLKSLKAHVHNVGTQIGLWLIPKLDKLMGWVQDNFPYIKEALGKDIEFCKNLGKAFYDTASDIGKAVGTMIGKLSQLLNQFNILSDAGAGIADLFNMGAGPDDTNKIYAANDKKMGWKPGTTAARIKNHVATKTVQTVSGPGHALGGFTDNPVGGALAVLHGKELVVPMGNPPRARSLIQQSGIMGGGGGGGGITIGHVALTVVSPDADSAGMVVMDTLTSADFLTERS